MRSPINTCQTSIPVRNNERSGIEWVTTPNSALSLGVLDHELNIGGGTSNEGLGLAKDFVPQESAGASGCRDDGCIILTEQP
jgi:hypothetical protein